MCLYVTDVPKTFMDGTLMKGVKHLHWDGRPWGSEFCTPFRFAPVPNDGWLFPDRKVRSPRMYESKTINEGFIHFYQGNHFGDYLNHFPCYAIGVPAFEADIEGVALAVYIPIADTKERRRKETRKILEELIYYEHTYKEIKAALPNKEARKALAKYKALYG